MLCSPLKDTSFLTKWRHLRHSPFVLWLLLTPTNTYYGPELIYEHSTVVTKTPTLPIINEDLSASHLGQVKIVQFLLMVMLFLTS
ncbi:hypothetical protein E2C01_004081 [Portunus trituberculatus]|uniref:Uncharacterized protein n=1 Tax=Portunus trituberculatus TaxID=210409 RepID=A0A5B7CQE6_PORTR|nr:hypothetical protein [Portunus trituberculatus]